MVINFCTYFDSNYLDRGLLLYSSMRRHCPRANLFVLCLDAKCFNVLTELSPEGLYPIALTELEDADPALFAVKPTRSRIEYYFTLTPCYIHYLLTSRRGLDHVTYVDADLYFFSDPTPVITASFPMEIGIVPHRYNRGLRKMERFGRFNVAFNFFRNGETGKNCLKLWRSQCIDWCHDRIEGDRYADQKYLDDWPRRYGRQIVIDHPGVDLAPWNLGHHHIEMHDDGIRVDGAPLVCFHFHGVSRLLGTFYDPNLRRYNSWISPSLKRRLFIPYIQKLESLRRHSKEIFNGRSIRYRFLKRSPRPPLTDMIQEGLDQLACLALTLISGTLVNAGSLSETPVEDRHAR